MTLLAIAPRLELGISQFIHYDGYWHIFIASQNRWQLFKSEWRGDAHPILYYLLLRLISPFYHSHLAYRACSILPNLASVYLLGLVAQKELASPVLAPVAAAAFAFSMTIIDLSIDVRGYALALMLVLWAYYVFLNLIEQADNNRDRARLVWFGVLNSLAIATEYYAVFFAAACWSAVLVLVTAQPEFRQLLLAKVRRYRGSFAVATLLPLGTFMWLYVVHLRYQPPVESNVLDFYWDRHLPAWQFIVHGLASDLGFMLPFRIGSASVLVFLLLAWISLVVYGVLNRRSNHRELASTITGVTVLLLTGELAVLGLARRYPFGGYARQQSILFPFFILSAFVIVDRIVSVVSQRAFRVWAALALTAAILWNFHSQWLIFPKSSTELFTAEFTTFQSEFGCAPAVYVDQFSLIAYYTHTYDAKWKFRRHLLGPQRADTYDVSCPAGKTTTLLRNLDSWNFDLSSPAFYAVLADLIRQTRPTSVALFFVKQGGHSVTDQVENERRRSIISTAQRFGLTAEQIVLTHEDAFIRFVLQ